MDNGPSTYTPFFRRFTNEHAKELEETRALYEWVTARPTDEEKILLDIGRTVMPLIRHLPDDVTNACFYAQYDILTSEAYLGKIRPPQFDKWSLKEFVDYRNLLHAKQYFIKNRRDIIGYLDSVMGLLFERLAKDLPKMDTPSPFTIPLMHTLADPKKLIGDIIGTFNQEELSSRGIFRPIGEQLYENICAVNGRTEKNNKPLAIPQDSKLPLDEIVTTYLKGTPFVELFNTPIPLKITQEDRFSHLHIIGGTGAGKTTLIEKLILHDLAQDSPPSIVLVDPHSDLIRKLVRADIGISDRVILIDPRDVEYPPAINIFALNQDRLQGYDQATREQVTAGVIQTFDYLFSGLIGADLTAKQGVFFRYVARLMLSLPEHMGRNATIIDMLHLMSDETPYLSAIKGLPDLQRDFFERDFKNKTFQQTKEQIRYRLQAILENPTLARLFTSTETKVDLFTELNSGKIILVDTAKDFLKGASANFGRIFISLILQAVLERAAIAEAARKPTFLYVDEAASYFDSNIDDLLTEARKYKCGLVLAHQYLDQASPSLKASLHANTNIKMVSGLSAGDARAMAPEMRTTADFILGQNRLQFATHIRNVTPQAVTIPLDFPSPLPQLDLLDYQWLIERNQKNVSTIRASVPEAGPAGSGVAPENRPPAERPPVGFPSPQEPDEDISSEW